MSNADKLLILAVESSAARSAVAVMEYAPGSQSPVPSQGQLGTENWERGTAILAVRDFPRGAGGVGAGSPAAAAEAALAEAGRRAAEVGLLAVSVGPGSYTGLRIGISFAKTFAWATGAAVVAVPSLVALATTGVAGCGLRVAGSGAAILVPTADAFRGQLYARAFTRTETGALTALTEDLVLTPGELMGRLRQLPPSGQQPATRNPQPPFVLFGSGAAKHRAALDVAAREAGLTPSISDEPGSPSVEVVGRLGLGLFLAGKAVTAHDLVPVYLRKTEAEERADERERRGA
ncbi:MAG TPA: tRNA (adenosine(37)-N6)-threonylcarbamoyltransferase complex dimerization subunit type 1 TsaB [Planctomycetota bacterium]|nr:tRNA (adenosine(37)-N6)-threonylcarbamoyltransferase complex dimerization subunit type 1 TsaB [Planctomycetota bacterium]